MKTYKVLFQADPMGIGTVQNNLFDEYATEAKIIDILVANNVPLKDAVVNTFNKRYYVGCLSPNTVETLCRLLAENYANFKKLQRNNTRENLSH